ncbi:MAG TPA: thermonuclease family protein [Acidimicrobiales bacterium]|nr:thermonuclease family protein [Acidimicrobiales bacterium]
MLAGCAEGGGSASAPGVATVVEVVDGDTIRVRIDGRVEPVRLIGIDTPETHHPTRPVECFGAEATARTAELLAIGSEVRLERDVEPRDRFDRVLAYVHRVDDDLFVNLALVAEGFAVAGSYPPNLARQADLDAAGRRARADGLGLWGACGGPDTPVQPSG